MQSTQPTQRFTNRAVAYHAHRPRYTADLLSLLTAKVGLTPAWVVADIGSGTGISSEPFLKNGNSVYGIEPNADMRAMGERNLSRFPSFHSIEGTAEATSLPDGSVDLVIAGQAFHWFDRPKASAEFARILRPGGAVALMWNQRLTDTSPFAAAYEAILLEHSLDYAVMDPKKVSSDEAAIAAFLGANSSLASFRHRALVNFDFLVGLLESASYAPLPGHPKYSGLIEALRRAFAAHAENGAVPLDYQMNVYCAPRFDPRAKSA